MLGTPLNFIGCRTNLVLIFGLAVARSLSKRVGRRFTSTSRERSMDNPEREWDEGDMIQFVDKRGGEPFWMLFICATRENRAMRMDGGRLEFHFLLGDDMCTITKRTIGGFGGNDPRHDSKWAWMVLETTGAILKNER